MTKTVHAVFDGKALLPEETVDDLIPYQRYLIQIIFHEKPLKKKSNRVLQRILARATDLGVSDLAAQHDHYLYGTEKR
ncbi:hypothetical protein L0Z72_11110 [candidate division KSB1 bacterium]|nr:hypothetical protein [candidate division KSB1 bacterium]